MGPPWRGGRQSVLQAALLKQPGVPGHREGDRTRGLPGPCEGEVGDVKTAPGAKARAPAAGILLPQPDSS